MKLPAVFKPKTPAVPVAEWVDQAALQALQDQASAAMKINEPVERFVALKTAAAAVDAVLGKPLGFGIAVPLTAEGQAQLAAHDAANDRRAIMLAGGVMAGSFGVGVGLLAVTLVSPAILVLPLVGAAFLSVPSTIAGGIYVGKKYVEATRLVLDSLHDDMNQLCATQDALNKAIYDVESTLTLEEASQSPHLNAALDLSPAPEERFNKEASRKLIITAGQKPVVVADTAPVIPPKRPNGAL